MEGVLQSQDELTFDGNTVIEVLMIEMPHGSRRLYALSKEEWNLKKCLVVVQNEDSLCAARAISICLSNIRDGLIPTCQCVSGWLSSRRLTGSPFGE